MLKRLILWVVLFFPLCLNAQKIIYPEFGMKLDVGFLLPEHIKTTTAFGVKYANRFFGGVGVGIEIPLNTTIDDDLENKIRAGQLFAEVMTISEKRAINIVYGLRFGVEQSSFNRRYIGGIKSGELFEKGNSYGLYMSPSVGLRFRFGEKSGVRLMGDLAYRTSQFGKHQLPGVTGGLTLGFDF